MENSFAEFGKMNAIYERNNRNKEMKALRLISFFSFLIIAIRCFPSCNQGGHTTRGFCGSSLLVKINIKVNQDSPLCQNLDIFWESGASYIAEMRTSCSPGLSELRVLDKELIFSNIRTKERKCQPYLLGQVTCVDTLQFGSFSVKQVTVIFNAEHNAWHYGWVSHKHTSHTHHVVDIMVLIESPLNPTHFVVAASYLSPEFIVSSTKNTRYQRDFLRLDYSSDEPEKDDLRF